MSKNRDKRAATAKETIDILERGFYQNQQEETIDIQENLQAAIKNSIHYSEEDFSSVFFKLSNKQIKENQNLAQFEINNGTTLNAASRLVNEEGFAKVLCLNFASAKNPGGGFLNGSQAQEESLARATGLYPCISQMTEMYEKNRYSGSCLYLDDMIYSPEVPVIRGDNDELLDKPFLISILTVPGVNAGAVRKNGKKQEINKIESTMLQRTEKLLSVAAVNDYKVLVLGAWGCGVFKNNPHDVAGYFHHHLVENTKFSGLFEKVVFAVLDNTKEESIVDAFRERFNR
ncbi:TIGR02452 family protein [Rivularia sp. PCC 7116]|uniref:TIGR02452 family protein n=1 Tax=Rivularia sp. PCC 7116 TaxID=373994 RepID=UPI00029EEC7C|nr:TIGR02452 family protein [Rivularia sp. PCC 7116]AFY53261.1 TIGR02452 family protein [Rivularia sp. PCC 7116]